MGKHFSDINLNYSKILQVERATMTAINICVRSWMFFTYYSRRRIILFGYNIYSAELPKKWLFCATHKMHKYVKFKTETTNIHIN